MERFIFRAFQCEVELDYVTVSRLTLVSVANVCESIKNWWHLIILAAVLRSAAFCVRLRNTLRKWFVTTVLTLPTHVLRPHIILYWFSVIIQKQFFRVFQLFAPEVKNFYQRLERIRKSYSFSENDLKYEVTLANNLLRKEQKLPTSLEHFFHFDYSYCVWLSLAAVTVPVANAACERNFSKIKFENFSQKFHDQWKVGQHWSAVLSVKRYELKNRFRWFRWWIWQPSW